MRLVNLDAQVMYIYNETCRQDIQVMYIYNETGKPGCPCNVHLYWDL